MYSPSLRSSLCPHGATHAVTNISLLQSYMGGLANTHSSLKTASLDLDLSTTGMSGLMTGRDENIQLMPDMPDDDEDDEVRKFSKLEASFHS